MFFTRRARFYVGCGEETNLRGLVGHLHQIGDAVEGVDLREVVTHLVVVVDLRIEGAIQSHIQHLDHFHRSGSQRLLVRIQEHKDQIDVIGEEEEDAIHIEGVLHTSIHQARSIDEIHVRKATLLRYGYDGAEVLDQSLAEFLDSLQLGKVTQRRLSLEGRRFLHTRSHESEATALNGRSCRENVFL